MAADYQTLGIVGCGDCCAACQTGGSEQIKEAAAKLTEESKKEIVFSFTCEAPCDQRIIRRDLRRVSKELSQVDALVVMTCGIGVQSLAHVVDKPLIPTNNTQFPGSAARLGAFYEYCSTCGDCVLGETAAICPVTMCPKGLLNGPCEEVAEGMCDVFGYQKPCAWTDIYARLKARNSTDYLQKVRPARDWSSRMSPRQVVWAR